MKPSRTTQALPVIALAALAGVSRAADKPASPLSELSLQGRWGYDGNVFATEAERPGYALANRVDRYWQAVVKVGVNLPDTYSAGTKTALSYQATETQYDRYNDTESNTAHRVGIASTGTFGAWRTSLDGTVTYVDGSDQTPRYLTYSAYGMAIPRERREQLQSAVKAEIRRIAGRAYMRIQGSYTFFDLMTEKHQPVGDYTGWMNYIDRGDAWGGLGAGLKTGKTTVGLDWRRGGQYQQGMAWAPASGSNEYNRILATLESELVSGLKVSVTGGPDWRYYPDRNASIEAKDVTPYVEGAVSYKVNSEQTLSAAVKRWRWVSSSGRSSYDDSSYGITLKSAWSPQLITAALVQWQESDYVLPVVRRDTLMTYSLGAQYKLSPHWTATADLSHVFCNNHVATLAAQGREFVRDLFAVGLRWSR